MSNKPPVPDELIMISKYFSWSTAVKVGRWWLAAFTISAVFDLFFPDLKNQLSWRWRATIVAAEFVAIFLFIFDAMKFIRRMDELQRQLTVTIFLFATSATLVFFLLWECLDRERFFYHAFGLSPDGTMCWGICSVAHVNALLGGFYGLGFLIFKRRYK